MKDLVLSQTSTITPSRDTHSVPAAYALHHDKSGRTYVGSTGNLYARMSQHRTDLKRGVHKNPNLQEAFNDDPKFSMSFMATESKEQAVEIEQHLITTHHSSGRLLNIATDAINPGAGQVISDEQKEKLRSATQQQFSDPEYRQRHSEIIKQKWEDPEYRQKNTGRVLSEESIAKVSDSVKQNWTDPSYREQQVNRLNSPEHREMLVAAVSKPVVVDGVDYPSNAEAARQLGLKPSTLRARLKREQLKSQ
ncbi:GIY-YIG catalytic domain protein [compost metagenome]